ncbi:MAG: NosD domain-containing protein [Candidatus Odinarchaeota archaeon]
MNEKQKICSGLLAVILVILIPPVIDLSLRKGTEPTIRPKMVTQDQSIVITGNGGFSANFTGSGTPGDPYVLEDVIINADGPSGINISNTDAYFRIENVLVNGSNYDYTAGIYLENVTNGQINNSGVTNSTYGFVLVNSSYNTLTGNRAYNNTRDGFILALSSKFNTLTGNTAYNNGEVMSPSSPFSKAKVADTDPPTATVPPTPRNGFGLTESSNNTLIGNTAYNNTGYGFYLTDSSENNSLMDNTAMQNTNGFDLDMSNYNTLSGNTALKNSVDDEYSSITGAGFAMMNAIYSILVNNTAHDNAYGFALSYHSFAARLVDNTAHNNTCGFFLSDSGLSNLTGNTAMNNERGFSVNGSSSYNNTLTENNVYNSTEYGIMFNDCLDNRVYLNFIIDNYPAGQQGYDSGTDNYWDNGTHGNYWSDYTGADAGGGIGNINYTLAGSSPPNNDTKPLVFSFLATISTLQLTGPGNQAFEAGSTGIYTITWVPTSNILPGTYQLYIDSSLSGSGNWTSGAALQADVDRASLTPGTEYNYTLVISDYSGKTAVNTVILSVKNATATTVTTTTTTGRRSPGWTVFFTLLAISCAAGVHSRRRSERKR